MKKYKDIYRDMTGEKTVVEIDCSNDDLDSLEGAPEIVDNDFKCQRNYLKTLEFGPIFVYGGYNCCDNELTTLEGAPSFVGKSFDCSGNYIKSLEFAPTSIGGTFYCQRMRNMTNDEIISDLIKYKITAKDYSLTGMFFKQDKLNEMAREIKKTQAIKSKGFRTLLGLKNEI